MPGPGEMLWRDDDQDTAVAYMVWLEHDKAERCPRCGTKETDWIGPDPETGQLRELRDPAWRATVRRCVGCAELEDKNGDLDDGTQRDGRSVVLTPNDPNADVDASGAER